MCAHCVYTTPACQISSVGAEASESASEALRSGRSCRTLHTSDKSLGKCESSMKVACTVATHEILRFFMYYGSLASFKFVLGSSRDGGSEEASELVD